MRPVIKYISFYDFADSKIARNYSVAATNKMDYIVDTLVSVGYDVEIVSASACIEQGKFKWYRGEVDRRKAHVVTRFFSSFRSRGKVLSLLRLVWSLLQLFHYLIWSVKRGDSIWVYHSLYYYNVLLLAQKIKRFKIILEVEEIYQDVSRFPGYMCRWEYKMVSVADKFVFSTDLLDERLNTQGKPSVVIYGTYRTEIRVGTRFDDEKIHVVYAGILDPNKKGAVAAVSSAVKLPSNYRLHILGFGSDKERGDVEALCAEVSSQGGATVTYDGLLKGRSYIEFLQRCQIGLSTQDPSAKFNATSFPSKILSYMSNGLQVVSIDIEAVHRSPVAKYLYFYKEQTPDGIANAILSVNIKSPVDTQAVVQELDREFVKKISSFLNVGH